VNYTALGWIRGGFFKKPTQLEYSEFVAEFIRVIGFVTLWSEKSVTESLKFEAVLSIFGTFVYSCQKIISI